MRLVKVRRLLCRNKNCKNTRTAQHNHQFHFHRPCTTLPPPPAIIDLDLRGNFNKKTYTDRHFQDPNDPFSPLPLPWASPTFTVQTGKYAGVLYNLPLTANPPSWLNEWGRQNFNAGKTAHPTRGRGTIGPNIVLVENNTNANRVYWRQVWWLLYFHERERRIKTTFRRGEKRHRERRSEQKTGPPTRPLPPLPHQEGFGCGRMPPIYRHNGYRVRGTTT